MSNQVSITQQNQTVLADVYSVRDEFEACLVKDSDINFDKEAQFALQVLTDPANKYALGIATGSPSGRQSTMSAIKNIASIGISLNPARKQAYLVPRKGRICLDISYQGLIDIAVQSGSIKWAQSRIVHEKDFFELNGVDKEPTHRFQPFGDRGHIVGVYVTVKTIDGDYLTEAMSVDEVNVIRDRSESFKKHGNGPWLDFWSEMAKKTVVKRAQKYWPKTDRLAEAIHYLNEEGEEGLAKDIGSNSQAQDTSSVFDKWAKRADSASSIEQLRSEMKEAGKECRQLKDNALWDRLKEYFTERSHQLKPKVIEGEYTEQGDAQ